MTLTASDPTVLAPTDLIGLFRAQRKAFLRDGPPSADVRRDRIDRLVAALLSVADPLTDALDRDFGHRPAQFSLAVEVLSVVDAAGHARDHLQDWMKPTVVDDPAAAYMPTTIDVDPLGVVGIIGPWNFPVSLVLQPTVEALAAGNRVMIKFSDMDPHTGAVLAESIANFFPPEEILVINGDLDMSTAFSDLPFDHLFFTGSPAVGKLVARAAAANLTPVTLELGGKNPVVIARDADLVDAAERIAASRMVNGGQVCLCPDYALVPAEKLDVFADLLRDAFVRLFPDLETNPSLVSIIDERNYDRVTGLIDDAISKGAQAISAHSGTSRPLPLDRAGRRIAPTVLLGVTDGMKVADEEIFGPVIAVLPYDAMQQAVDYIAGRPSPLVAYYYGDDGEEFAAFRAGTASGGVTRNDFAVHLSLHDVPFGGVGRSGTGSYHGKAGFDTFSHRRPVAHSLVPGSVARALAPGGYTDDGLAALRGAVDAALDAVTARLAGS